MFYAVILGQVSEERLKITNVSKVPCTVNLAIQSRRPGGAAKDEAKLSDKDIGFDVKPRKISIGPQEHSYVTINFTPTAIRNYSAMFEAVVQGGIDQKTNKILFELRGDATLPQVIVQQPTQRTKSGAPLLKFRKLLLGKSQVLPVIVHNDGIISAGVKLELAVPASATNTISYNGFTILGGDRFVTIEPKQTHVFDVQFQAPDTKTYSQDIRLKIQNNNFENTVISAIGEGFTSDVSIENMPVESEDELRFGECPVGMAYN